MKPNLQFAESVLNTVATNYNEISDKSAERDRCLDGFVQDFKSEAKSGIVTTLSYGQIFPAYKDIVVSGGEVNHVELDQFQDFYIVFVSELRTMLATAGKIEIIKYPSGITRSKSPSIEAYDYVGHNNLTFHPRR